MSQAKREKHAPDEHGLSLTRACWHPGTLPLETVVGTELPCRETSQRCLLSLERSDSVHWPAQAALPVPTSHPCCQPLCLPRQEFGCSPPELRAALRPGVPTQHPRIFLSVRLCRMATVFVWNCTSASHSHGLRISVSPLPSSVSVGFGSAQGTVPQLAPLTSPRCSTSPSSFQPSPPASPLLNNPSLRLNPL